MGLEKIKYDAFISYRHCILDKFVAINLHKKLESFKLPKSVIEKTKTSKRRIERVFRDEDELPLAENLSDHIDAALSNSEFLIVICTPRLKESRWCLREIETFLKKNDRKNILVVLAEGEPDESFPEILTYKEEEIEDEAGNTTVVKTPIEPLAADVRGKNKKEILKAMDIAVIKLAAAMFDLNFDDLKQRHREQKIKKTISMCALASGIFFAFSLICLFMLIKIKNQNEEIKIQNEEIISQNEEIEDRYASSMAINADEMLKSGKRQDAIYALLSVLPDTADKFNEEAYCELVYAMGIYVDDYTYFPDDRYRISTDIADFTISDDGSYIAIYGDCENLYILDGETGDIVYEEDCILYNYAIDSAMVFDGNNALIYSLEDSIVYYDIKTGQKKILTDLAGSIIHSDKTDIINILLPDRLLAYREGEELYEVKYDEIIDTEEEYAEEEYAEDFYTEDSYAEDLYLDDLYDELSYIDASYSADGKYYVIAFEYAGKKYVMEFETNTGKKIADFQINANYNLQVATDGNNIYAANEIFESGETILYSVDSSNVESYIQTVCIDRDLKDLQYTDFGLYVLANESIAIYKDAQLYDCEYISGLGTIINAFAEEDGIYTINVNGIISFLDNGYSNDITNNYFAIVPDEIVLDCKYVNGSYYYHFDEQNSLVLYEKNENDNKTEFEYDEEKTYKYENVMTNCSNDINVCEKIKGIEKNYVSNAFYSSDEKYFLVEMKDDSLRFYDGKNLELIKLVNDPDIKTPLNMVYIEENDTYIINSFCYSYILNSDLEYITELYSCVAYEDSCFILNFNGMPYKVKYMSYEDVIKKAKDYLGDYKPSAAISEKYGLK